ncbi:MAG: hypothetical protein R2853_20985 [Thermomicrobiales bacterium]
MDAAAFDHLSRALSVPGTRRRLLGLLATLPLLGWVDPEASEAKDRRRRRKGRHKTRRDKAKAKGQRQRRKRACKPQSVAKTCAGTCGPITNRQTCGKTVDCGSCDCPTPCGECLTCQGGPNTPGACVPDPAQVGEACGNDGQVCLGDGACACDTGSCANPTPICAGGTCAACATSNECAAAGMGGVCCAGSCYEGVCCDADGCLAEPGAPDCVDHDCVCTGNGNAACTGDDICCAAGCFDLQTDPGHCGDCAVACPATAPVCVAGECEACSATRLCPAGQYCQADGSCVATCPVCQTGSAGLCVADASLQHRCASPCPSGEWCHAGACASIQATVTIPDCQSLCSGSTEVCGQTVTCPGCSECRAQTGCLFSNVLPDGPAGLGSYCSQGSNSFRCSTSADCAGAGAFTYCSNRNTCARTCPF